MKHRFPRLLILLLLSMASCLVAQDAPKIEPQTVGNPAIDVTELALRLKPLTVDELKAEADAWQGLLAKETAAVSEAEIAKSTEEVLAPMRTKRGALGDRMNAVINELGFKGGEIEGYQAYVAATTGNRIDLESNAGPAAYISRIKTWLTSPDGGIKFLIGILKFLAILWIAKIVAKIAGRLMRKLLDKSPGISNLLKDFIVNSVRRVIFLLGLVLALGAIGLNIGPLLAGVGVLGMVIGFALQDTLSNFAAGFMILLNRPYDIGDLITVGGQQGVVASMTLVSTTINTLDNQKIIIPNGKIWGDTINNMTGNDTRRVDLMFGIDYGDDVEKAKKVLADICAKSDLILQDPGTDVEVHELADSSVNLICRPWCKTSDYWKVHWHVTEEAKRRFDSEGLSFPFPQQDVNMKPVAGAA